MTEDALKAACHDFIIRKNDVITLAYESSATTEEILAIEQRLCDICLDFVAQICPPLKAEYDEALKATLARGFK